MFKKFSPKKDKAATPAKKTMNLAKKTNTAAKKTAVKPKANTSEIKT
jgi:hypothetical protein